jgi:hypothetical protein
MRKFITITLLILNLFSSAHLLSLEKITSEVLMDLIPKPQMITMI